MPIKNTIKNGFTLVELILYLGLTALIITAAIQFVLVVFSVRSKSTVNQELTQNLRFASAKIIHEIRRASGINSLTASSLSLSFADSSRNPTVFDLSGGRIRMGFGSGGNCPSSSPCPITSNLINISALSFTNLSTGDSKSVNIKFSTTGNFINPGSRQEYDAVETFTGSAELRLK